MPYGFTMTREGVLVVLFPRLALASDASSRGDLSLSYTVPSSRLLQPLAPGTMRSLKDKNLSLNLLETRRVPLAMLLPEGKLAGQTGFEPGLRLDTRRKKNQTMARRTTTKPALMMSKFHPLPPNGPQLRMYVLTDGCNRNSGLFTTCRSPRSVISRRRYSTCFWNARRRGCPYSLPVIR